MSGPRGGTILMAVGGTAGHVHPALAVAQALSEIAPAARVVLAGTRQGMESWIVPRAGLPLEWIPVRPLRGGSSARLLTGVLALPRALLAARGLLRRVRPDVVLGVGGHVSGAIAACAAALRLPLAVLESDVLPGLANRCVAPLGARRLGGWSETAAHFGRRTLVTGVPVRAAIARVPGRVPDGTLGLLVLGGSSGSPLVNDALRAAATALAPLRGRLRIAHQSGASGRRELQETYARLGFAARVEPYFEAIESEYAAADLVVSAAGAVTCAELLAAGRPSALIPLPAAGQHQRHNARAMVDRAAAVVLEGPGATAAAAILALLGDEQGRAEMACRARAAARPGAAHSVARHLLALAGGRAAC